MNKWMRPLAALALLAPAALMSGTEPVAAEETALADPNVVFISTDDLRVHATSR